jgi:hypothetical protein
MADIKGFQSWLMSQGGKKRNFDDGGEVEDDTSGLTDDQATRLRAFLQGREEAERQPVVPGQYDVAMNGAIAPPVKAYDPPDTEPLPPPAPPEVPTKPGPPPIPGAQAPPVKAYDPPNTVPQEPLPVPPVPPEAEQPTEQPVEPGQPAPQPTKPATVLEPRQGTPPASVSINTTKTEPVSPGTGPISGFGENPPANAPRAPKEYLPMIASASQRYGVPPEILIALITQESGFNAGATGSSGEIGLGQIMPSTAKSIGVDPNTLRDPATNIDTAAKYLAKVAGKDIDWHDPKQAAAALTRYNGGGDPN